MLSVTCNSLSLSGRAFSVPLLLPGTLSAQQAFSVPERPVSQWHGGGGLLLLWHLYLSISYSDLPYYLLKAEGSSGGIYISLLQYSSFLFLPTLFV